MLRMRIFKWFSRTKKETRAPDLKIIKNSTPKKTEPTPEINAEKKDNLYSLEEKLSNRRDLRIKNFLLEKVHACSVCNGRDFIHRSNSYISQDLVDINFKPINQKIPCIMQVCRGCGLISSYALGIAFPDLLKDH